MEIFKTLRAFYSAASRTLPRAVGRVSPRGAAIAMLVAQSARWIDIDGPLLLARDREPGVVFIDGVASPPRSALWG